MIASISPPLTQPLVNRARRAAKRNGTKAGISAAHIGTSFLLPRIQFVAIVILFVTHQKCPHPLSYQNQNDTTDKPINGVETEQSFPWVQFCDGESQSPG